MKIITCASYFGTGSSAVTDFVSEFNSVYSCTNMEFRFIQDPDGIIREILLCDASHIFALNGFTHCDVCH